MTPHPYSVLLIPHTQHSLPVQSNMQDVKINDGIAIKGSPLYIQEALTRFT